MQPFFSSGTAYIVTREPFHTRKSHCACCGTQKRRNWPVFCEGANTLEDGKRRRRNCLPSSFLTVHHSTPSRPNCRGKKMSLNRAISFLPSPIGWWIRRSVRPEAGRQKRPPNHAQLLRACGVPFRTLHQSLLKRRCAGVRYRIHRLLSQTLEF